MTRREITLPAHLPDTVTVSQESPCDLVDRLSQNGAKRLYIDGGLTIQSFLAAGLIDDLTLTLIPILLDSGSPLFGPLPSDVRLIRESTRAFDFGFVQNRYRVEQTV